VFREFCCRMQIHYLNTALKNDIEVRLKELPCIVSIVQGEEYRAFQNVLRDYKNLLQ